MEIVTAKCQGGSIFRGVRFYCDRTMIHILDLRYLFITLLYWVPGTMLLEKVHLPSLAIGFLWVVSDDGIAALTDFKDPQNHLSYEQYAIFGYVLVALTAIFSTLYI